MTKPTDQGEELRSNQERLLDLVRHQRAELHDAGLITDDEYADLVNVGSTSARRLEGYDEIRAREEALRAEVERWEELCAERGASLQATHEALTKAEARAAEAEKERDEARIKVNRMIEHHERRHKCDNFSPGSEDPDYGF